MKIFSPFTSKYHAWKDLVAHTEREKDPCARLKAVSVAAGIFTLSLLVGWISLGVGGIALFRFLVGRLVAPVVPQSPANPTSQKVKQSASAVLTSPDLNKVPSTTALKAIDKQLQAGTDREKVSSTTALEVIEKPPREELQASPALETVPATIEPEFIEKDPSEGEAEFLKAFSEVCKKLEELTPDLVEKFSFEQNSYSHESLGHAIQMLNKHDPVLKLIRIDPMRTYGKLQEDERFKHLAYRTALFNLSRDAAMRLKASELSSSLLHPEVVPLFKQYQNLYGDYLSGDMEKKGDFLVHQYMYSYLTLITENFKAEYWSNTYSYQFFDQKNAPSIQSYLLGMPKRARPPVSPLFDIEERHPQFPVFIYLPTYASVSTSTFLKAWGAGLFLLGCTSCTFNRVHLKPYSAQTVFEHDKDHIEDYLWSLSQKLASPRQFPLIQKNATKILDHLSRLTPTERLGLEYVLFSIHHEYYRVFAKDEIEPDNQARNENGRWILLDREKNRYALHPIMFESPLFTPWDKKYAALSKEKILQAWKDYRAFASKHFTK